MLLLTCSEPFDVQTPHEKISILPEFVYSSDGKVRFNGKYLEFSTPEALEETKLMIRKSNAGVIEKWFQQFNFVSMQNIYEKALQDQNTYLDVLNAQYTNYNKAQLSQLQKPKIVHSQLLKDYSHLFNFDRDGLIRGLKIFHPELAHLVNADGILKVGGHLFQYNDKNMKIIIGGDENKMPLLNRTEVTDHSNKIIVSNVISLKDRRQGRYVYNNEVSKEYGLGETRTYRIIGRIQLNLISTPVYGDPICEGDCGSVPIARSNRAYCYCEYPITGYSYNTIYKTNQETQKAILWWWGAHHPLISRIEVYADINGQNIRYTKEVEGYSNVYLVVYDGPIANVSANHVYYNFEVSGNMQVNTYDIYLLDRFSD